MKVADDTVRAIKAATAALIHKAGQPEAAALVCRASPQVLYEYMSINRPDRVIPVDVALQLEAFVGAPIVTGTLARLQGLTLGRPAQAQAPEIGRAVATVSRQAGAAVAAFLDAHADGVIDPGEMAELRRLLETVRDGADATLSGLAGPALRVVA